MLWPLRRCALRVLNHGTQADARPAVRARASTKKEENAVEKKILRAPTLYDKRWQRKKC
jgi:hypothetical protein